MLRIVGFVLGLLLVQNGTAQQAGSCARAQAAAVLDLGNIRARVVNNGNLFKDQEGVPLPWYEAPKGSGINPLGIGNFQIGGLVDDTMRVAAAHWGGPEFWPGPIPEDGSPPDSTTCGDHDRIWQLSREDVEIYKRTGTLTRDIKEWPYHLGALVLDGDDDRENYSLAGGDLPALMGDQTLWWVMNDQGNRHQGSQSPPLGMEARVTAYAFDSPGVLHNTIFYRYRLRYRGERPITQTWVGLWVTAFLGYGPDDYAGADTTLDMGYFYNSEEMDPIYGAAPPAIGIALLQGPKTTKGTRLGMSSLMYSRDDSPVPNKRPEHYYHFMNGRWKDGTPVREAGDGWRETSGAETTFQYAGDPVSGSHWSMENPNNDDGPRLPAADGMIHLFSGPFRMERGDEQEVVFAIVWSRGEDRLDSVRKLRDDVSFLRSISDHVLTPSVQTTATPDVPELGFSEAFPNPFSAQTTIRYSVPKAMRVRLSVFDVLGREVATLVDDFRQAGKYTVNFNAESLVPGVYAYRFEMDRLTASKLMVLVR
jgi:hypothetical protein